MSNKRVQIPCPYNRPPTPDAPPIESRAQTEERVWNEALQFLEDHLMKGRGIAWIDFRYEGKRKGYIK